jgi:L-aspartate-alpha-decarboxylase
VKKFIFCPACQGKLTPMIEDNNHLMYCRKCGGKYYTNPLPSAVAFVRNLRGDILLVKRGVEPGIGKWALPSGFIEENELPEQAVVRELLEETGVQGSIERLVGVYTEPTKLYGNVLLIAYVLNLTGGRLRAGSDCRNAKFYPADRLPDIPFSGHRAIIRDGLNKPGAKDVRFEILKSKITELIITKTALFYNGSIGIDSRVMAAANMIVGEKVHVLNYDNGERFITYTIAEKPGSGKVVLYGPAAHKGKKGERICVLSYAQVSFDQAPNYTPTVISLNKKNRLKK